MLSGGHFMSRHQNKTSSWNSTHPGDFELQRDSRAGFNPISTCLVCGICKRSRMQMSEMRVAPSYKPGRLADRITARLKGVPVAFQHALAPVGAGRPKGRASL